jgi:hypothetical protein
MSRFEGPQGIVTNGLVLNLDAGDPDSYTRSQPPYVEVLVVAGGGSGGGSTAGGGGAGGLIYNSAYQITNAAAITVTVGAGGAGVPQTTVGNDGSNSVFGALTAIGGGGGGMTNGSGGAIGRNGGSGGGGAHYSSMNFGTPGTGTPGQGFNGGNGSAGDQNSFPGGGGGGAGQPGGDPTFSKSGNGGNGLTFSISGTSTTYAGGGGGGSISNGGNGGTGGGAAGTSNGTAGGTATANTGGGGGGGWFYSGGSGGAGGSGIVIVRYPGLPAATGGTITYLNGYTIHTFTSSGTFTPYLWNDLSGGGRNGTLVNGVSFNSYQNGGVFNFDGTDDRVRISQNNIFYNNAFTWEFWLKFDSFPNTYSGIVWAEGSTGGGSGLQYLLSIQDTSGTRVFHYRISNTVTGWANTDTAVIDFTPTNWTHIVWTFDNGTTKIYTQGSLFHTNTTRGSYNGGTDSPVFLAGRNDSFGSLDGEYGVTRFYNRALTQAEVTQNYNAQKTRFGL